MASPAEFFEENSRFDIVGSQEKSDLMKNRKAENTNIATKQWVSCLQAYLNERKLGQLDDIETEDLPKIIGDFYFSIRKKTVTNDKNIKLSKTKQKEIKYYKNSSLKSGRAALNRHFKGTRGLDIINNDNFIKSNEIFQAFTKKG